jgi:hypothetical protein
MVGVTAGTPSYGQQAPPGGVSLVRKECLRRPALLRIRFAVALRMQSGHSIHPRTGVPRTRPAALPAQSANALGLAGDIA